MFEILVLGLKSYRNNLLDVTDQLRKEREIALHLTLGKSESQFKSSNNVDILLTLLDNVGTWQKFAITCSV